MTDQVPDEEYLVPSLISRNARLIHSSATNIIERLDWLNAQKTDDAQTEKVYSENQVQSRFTLNQRLQFSEVATVRRNFSIKSVRTVFFF